jgi:hypothetical protein
MDDQRYQQIIAAYEAALDGRQPGEVSIEALCPSIFAGVPNLTVEELRTALRLSATAIEHEREQLERYGQARFGGANDNQR